MMQTTTPEAASAAPLTPESRSTEFVSVSGGAETTSAEALLVTAYVVMWAIVFGFIFLTWRKQNGIEARLKELDAKVRAAQARIQP
jgi:CcmD family protein